jgi:predicted nuclease of predicted toxin-antitoxin system
MGVSYKVANWLNGAGHNAIHLSEEGLHTLEDYLIVEKAAMENRIILTADMDFGQILAFTRSDSVSIIQFRLFNLAPPNIISKLELALDKFANHLGAGSAIITIHENKIRFKKLPLE